MQCEHCGNQPAAGDKFCRQCGAPLGEGQEATILSPTPSTEPSVTSEISGWAVASLILGVASIMVLPLVGSVLAIAFGIMAKSEIKKEKDKLSGSRVASAGIIMGSLGLVLLVIALIIFFIIAFVFMDFMRYWDINLELEGASSVEARLEMRNGQLSVTGGARDNLEAHFIYSMLEHEPNLDYWVDEGKGRLLVKQPLGGRARLMGGRDQWDLAFRDEMPVELFVSLSSAEGNLDLLTVELISLELDTISGDAFVDLSGTKRMLEGVGLRSDSGDLALFLNGSYELPLNLDLSSDSGDIEVNLLGSFKQGLEGNLEMASGDLTLRLPHDVGVCVTVSTVSGEIVAVGLRRQEGGVLANDAYGSSPITLRLRVKSLSGDIKLFVE